MDVSADLELFRHGVGLVSGPGGGQEGAAILVATPGPSAIEALPLHRPSPRRGGGRRDDAGRSDERLRKARRLDLCAGGAPSGTDLFTSTRAPTAT